MLSNNVEALQKVSSLPSEEILRLLLESGLRNYGFCTSLVHELLSKGGTIVVGALENADADGVLTALAEQNPAGITAGLAAVANILGAMSGLLIVRSQKAADCLRNSADSLALDIRIEIGDMVDVRLHRQNIVLHLATLAAIGDLLLDQKPGTVLSVNGELKELPWGAALREAISPDSLKGVLIGHTLYPTTVLERTLTGDFPLGSGVIRTIDENVCVLCAVRDELMALRDKCCGKCVFCREGLYQLHTVIIDITENRTKRDDLALLAEIGSLIGCNTNCSLGYTAALPVLSALEHFESEVLAHTKKKTCPAGQCKAFFTIYVDPSECEGCGTCMDMCPVDCIEGKSGFISMIDEFDCTKCGKCMEACPNGAIHFTGGRVPKLPNRLTKVGRFRQR